jgi:O-antigen ligase/tetratricopeptide (TPR) repeat protein
VKARTSLPFGLLIAVAFLAPIMGGHVHLDAHALPNVAAAFFALFGDPEAALLSHAVLAVFPCMALAILLLTRKVVQVPNNTLSSTLMLFFALVAGSALLSSFRHASLPALGAWLSYAVAFFAVVAGLGRQRGPVLFVGAIAASCALLALLGVNEYYTNPDPTWRIFALWNNPNALAAMLLVGFFCGMGLLLARSRGEAMFGGGCAALCGWALWLTQSKGALLALAGVLLLLAVLVLFWSTRERRGATFARFGAVLAAVALLAMLVQMTSGAGEGGAPGGRVVAAGQQAEQSAGFRMNLWKGAVQMVAEQPIGYGVGTYRFESARPGVTTQTLLTHNAYLQLATEASLVAPLLLLGAAVLWLVHVCRGSRRLPFEQNMLRAGVIAAVLAVGAHSLIDSDLYYYGVGLTTFMLLGVGLLLASDSVAPENVPVGVRRAGAVGAAGLAVLMLYAGYVDLQRALLRGSLMGGDVAASRAGATALGTLAPYDGEAWFLRAQAAATPAERRQAMERAAELAPSTRNLRALARLQTEAKELPQAQTTLRRALVRDPNNLLTLLQLARVQTMAGDVDAAEDTYSRLIAVEELPYFRVRSLPELVPTETFEARVEMAARTDDPERRIELLGPAVEGFARYRQITVPRVLMMEAAGTNFGGESAGEAQRKMSVALDAARSLAAAHRSLGDTQAAVEAESQGDLFSRPLDAE